MGEKDRRGRDTIAGGNIKQIDAMVELSKKKKIIMGGNIMKM